MIMYEFLNESDLAFANTRIKDNIRIKGFI